MVVGTSSCFVSEPKNEYIRYMLIRMSIIKELDSETNKELANKQRRQIACVDVEKKGVKIVPFGRPFRKRLNLLCLLSPIVSVKLLFRTSSMIIRTMCLSGRSLSCCQIDKHGTILLLGPKQIINVLSKQNSLIHG